jgi:hypothetical protein
MVCQKLLQNIYKLSEAFDIFSIEIKTEGENFYFVIKNLNTLNFSRAGNAPDSVFSEEANVFAQNFSYEQIHILFNNFQQFENINFLIYKNSNVIVFFQQRLQIQITCVLSGMVLTNQLSNKSF